MSIEKIHKAVAGSHGGGYFGLCCITPLKVSVCNNAPWTSKTSRFCRRHRLDSVRRSCLDRAVLPAHPFARRGVAARSICSAQQPLQRQRILGGVALSTHPGSGTNRDDRTVAAQWRLSLSGGLAGVSRSHQFATLLAAVRSGGAQCFAEIARWRAAMLAQPPRAIFDLDSTVLTVYGHQERAEVGYNPKKRGRPSYLPLLCFEGRTQDCWEGSYHAGNVYASTVAIPLLELAFAKLPQPVGPVRVRADAGFFDHKIIEFIEGKRGFYAIVARLTRPLKHRLSGLRYRRVSPGVWAAELRYCPQSWPGPRRFVVIRRPVPEEPSAQLTLFQMGGYSYQVLVTNLALTPLHLWRFYNQRARAELIIRELKDAYALGKIPTKDFAANEAFFQIVLLAYNLLNWFKRLCVPPHLQRATLQRLRQRLFLVPAQLVRPDGVPTLRLAPSYVWASDFSETLRRIR